MATNNPEDPTKLTKPRVKFEDKERRIRIAYLENQQAELGTEIKLLKQRGELEESEADSGLENQKRMSSGLGESIESNPELDALSRMVVDKVLERISKTGPAPIQQQIQQPPANTVMAVSKVANCDDKSSLAVTQMRHLLQRERNLVSELQVCENRYSAVFQYLIVFSRLLSIQKG